MRRVIPPALLAAVLALAVSAAPATASELRLTPAKTGAFPERSYLLTLPASAALSAGQVSVTENGAPVGGLSVVPASAFGQGHFGTVLLIETSASMRGSAINAALGAARSFAQQRSSQQPLGVVEFDSSSRVVLPLTTDQKEVARALAAAPSLAPARISSTRYRSGCKCSRARTSPQARSSCSPTARLPAGSVKRRASSARHR